MSNNKKYVKISIGGKMKFEAERAKYILSFLFKNSNVDYNFGQLKYTIDINNTYHKEYYEEQEYNSFMTIILYIVEINIWKLHNIIVQVNGNELIFKLNDQVIDYNQILNIHAEDKRQIIQHIITRINEVNAKSKKTSNLIVEYNDMIKSNEKIIKDINDLKEMNNSFLGKLKIINLKSRKLFNFTNDESTPNRVKKYDDLYDILRIIKSNDKDYKENIYNYFINMKKNMENGEVYLLDYNKFQNSFTSCDLFLLNKILDIINLIIDNTNNIVTSNKLIISKQTNELNNYANDLKNSNVLLVYDKLSKYNISNAETYDFKDISYDNLKPDNTLKYIIKMYENIKYVEN